MYGLNAFYIGAAFTLPCCLYLLICPLMFWLTGKLTKPVVVFIGLLLLSVSMAFIGTSPILGIEHSANMMFGGLIIMGIAAPMISIPVLPDIIDSISETNDDLPPFLLNIISSAFVMSTEIGNATGPMISSVMKEEYGFERA
jgi:hypothetical protein